MIVIKKKRILGGKDRKTRLNIFELQWEPQSRKVTFSEKEARQVVKELAGLLK